MNIARDLMKFKLSIVKTRPKEWSCSKSFLMNYKEEEIPEL